MLSKTCTQCRIEPTRPGHSWCRLCYNAYYRNRYHNNPKAKAVHVAACERWIKANRKVASPPLHAIGVGIKSRKEWLSLPVKDRLYIKHYGRRREWDNTT